MEKIKRYNKSKFVEKEVITTVQSDVSSAIFKTYRFSMLAVNQAYEIYERISKICKKQPIRAYEFVSDFSKDEILKDKSWTDKFLNSSLFTMLEISELNSFAKIALDNEKLAYSFFYSVYKKKPTSVQGLLKITMETN